MPQAAETKDLILDVAELLFSENGVDGVSLRALTREAGVNLASAHYQFGSKEAVARTAFCRRVRPINAERLQVLAKIEREGTADIEEILTALYLPDLSQPDLYRRMHFAVGVMVHPMLDSNRIRQWTPGACDPLDSDGTLDAMVRFVAAGFRVTAKDSALAASIQETTQAA